MDQIIILEIFLLIIEFGILIKGADVFVDGARNVAYHYKIPAVIVGLTIVAFGTSAPEAAISIKAALGSSNISITNVIGSNIFNILGVIGVSALLGTLTVDKILIKRDFPFLVISSIGLLAIAKYVVIGNDGIKNIYGISQTCGKIFLIIIIAYVIYLVIKAREDKESMNEEGEIKLSIPKAVLYIIIGMIGIIIGGYLVVKSATAIAENIGINTGIIGLTVVAIGTSLPELVTSVNALKKGSNGIVVGNVLGSSIFNILFILGISSAIQPIKIEHMYVFDILFMTVVTILGAWFTYTKSEVNKKEGLVLVLLFIAYVTFTVCREIGIISPILI